MMTTRDRFRTEFGQEPLSVGVRCAMLNEDLQTKSAHRDSGLYRNIPYRSMDVAVDAIRDRPPTHHLLPAASA
jgi:hypothetical protein